MKNKKQLKLLWLIIPIALIIAIVSIKAVNSTYEYKPAGEFTLLEAGEKGILTINYDGADGMPETEQMEYTAYEPFELPTVSKQGYNFCGWSVNYSNVKNTAVLAASEARAWPNFEKDYSTVNSVAALYSEEFKFDEFDAGEYKSVNRDVVDVYLDCNYKMYIYEEENFAGSEAVLAYTGNFAGHIGSMKIVPIKTSGVEVKELNDNTKAELLKTFAPRIWWDKNEEYFASSVEFAFDNLSRVMGRNGYMLVLEDVDSPNYFDDYFYGDMDNANAYGFAVEKENKFLDLSYFVFTPYNKSKEIAGMQFGNHIGDWEHITIRLVPNTENGKTYYQPTIVDYSAHSFRMYYAWDDINVIDGTHPEVFTAQGSHGMWKDEGSHVYADAKIVKLTDECSKGTAWDLWQENNLETYCYDAIEKTGWGIGNSQWNTCFDTDYLNENSNSVTNWGNRGWSPKIQLYPTLQGGPGGPQQKGVLNNYYTLNDKQR